jgi:hypothetical protein
MRVAAHLLEPVDVSASDYRTAKPVSDEVFDVFAKQLAYVPSSITAPVEARDTTSTGSIREQTTIDVGYGGERMRGWYTGDDGEQRELDGQYPSMGQGFGLVNLRNSLFFDDAQGRSPLASWYHDVWREDGDAFPVGLLSTRTYEIDVARGAPFSVSMAYSDAPTALPVGTPTVVNNLDLNSQDGTLARTIGFNVGLNIRPIDSVVLKLEYLQSHPQEKILGGDDPFRFIQAQAAWAF